MPDIQAIFCRRRHQPSRPPLAKIKPGIAAEGMTSLKAPLGFFADFLESGAQSAIPNYEGPPKASRRTTREQDELDTLVL